MAQQPNDQHLQLRAQIAELQERDAEFARKANILLDKIVASQDRMAQFDERTNRFDRQLNKLSESTRRTQAITQEPALLMVQFAQNAEREQVSIRRIRPKSGEFRNTY